MNCFREVGLGVFIGGFDPPLCSTGIEELVALLAVAGEAGAGAGAAGLGAEALGASLGGAALGAEAGGLGAAGLGAGLGAEAAGAGLGGAALGAEAGGLGGGALGAGLGAAPELGAAGLGAGAGGLAETATGLTSALGPLSGDAAGALTGLNTAAADIGGAGASGGGVLGGVSPTAESVTSALGAASPTGGGGLSAGGLVGTAPADLTGTANITGGGIAAENASPAVAGAGPDAITAGAGGQPSLPSTIGGDTTVGNVAQTSQVAGPAGAATPLATPPTLSGTAGFLNQTLGIGPETSTGIVSGVKDFGGPLVAAGGLGRSLLQGNSLTASNPYAKAQAANANNAITQGNNLSSYIQNGTLPPGALERVKEATQAAISSTKQRYAGMGMAGSTAEAADISRINQQSAANGNVLATQLLQSGIQESQLGAQIYGQLMQAQTAQNQQVSQAIGNFAGAMAGGGTRNTPTVNVNTTPAA